MTLPDSYRDSPKERRVVTDYFIFANGIKYQNSNYSRQHAV
jgi:hypothetical protein